MLCSSQPDIIFLQAADKGKGEYVMSPRSGVFHRSDTHNSSLLFGAVKFFSRTFILGYVSCCGHYLCLILSVCRFNPESKHIRQYGPSKLKEASRNRSALQKGLPTPLNDDMEVTVKRVLSQTTIDIVSKGYSTFQTTCDTSGGTS
jgi:hypothetical protein